MAAAAADHGDLPCVVCQESLWDAGEDGMHVVCSLRCGHIFGRPCIETWIRCHGRKTASTCPLCSAPCALRDVWPMHVRGPLATIDADEHESTADALDAARAKRQALERDVGRATLALARTRQELRMLRGAAQPADATAPRAHVEQPRHNVLAPHSSTAQPGEAAAFVASVPIRGARVLAFGPATSTSVYVSTQQPGSACGYTLVSLYDVRHRMDVTPHTKPVRGLAPCPADSASPALVMTCAFDGDVAITSAQSRNVLHRLRAGAPCWACEWDAESAHRLHVAIGAGATVLTYDLRQPARPLATNGRPWHEHSACAATTPADEPGSRPGGPPFHSLVACRLRLAQPGHEQVDGTGAEMAASPVAGLLCASPQVVLFWPFARDGLLAPPGARTVLSLGGAQCTSVSFEAGLGMGVASFRSRVPAATASASAEQGAVHCTFADDGQPLACMGGHTAPMALSRSRLVVDASRTTYVAAGDDTSRSPWLWQLPDGEIACRLRPHAHAIVDVCQRAGSELVGVLSEQSLDLHRLVGRSQLSDNYQ